MITKEIEKIKDKNPDTEIHALGISFGEITALMSLGVLDLDSTLALVKKRGEIMKNAFDGIKSKDS